MKAKDLKVGMKVVVSTFGRRKVYPLVSVRSFPPLSTYGSAFIALGTEEWNRGIPELGASFDPDEEIEIEE